MVNRFFLRGLSFFLAILLVLTSFPIVNVGNAASNKPVEIMGYGAGVGSDIMKPLVYGDPLITLVGTFGGGVIGENLRYKISVNNGIPEEYDSIKPTVNDITFTFQDVSLKPGMNAISFYEKTGSITREVGKFYIEYNNTPLISNLTVDGVRVSDPTSPDIPPTLISVPNANRLNLTLAGLAKNTDKIEVTNNRKGTQVYTTFVPRTGNFSLNLPTELGENVLTIKGYSSNKEVTLIQRKILVTATSGEEANQLYDVRITNSNTTVPLLPKNTQAPAAFIGNNGNSIQLTGKVLLKIDENITEKLHKIQVEMQGNSNKNDVTITSVENTSNSGYKLYEISVPLPKSATDWMDGKVYEFALTYDYFTKNPTDNTFTISHNNNKINNTYSFKFFDSLKPKFLDVRYSSDQVSLSQDASNPSSVATSPLYLDIVTQNMQGLLFKVKYNTSATLTENVDYSLSAGTGGIYSFVLKKLPLGVGKLTIEATDSNGNLLDSMDVFINVEIAPYIQLVETASRNVFYDGYQSSRDTLPTLTGTIYNYNLKGNISANTASNVEIKLNGRTLNATYSTVSNQFSGEFTIHENQVANSLNRGINTLEIILTEVNVKFTYSISHVSAKTPQISDVKLTVEQNKDKSTLDLKSGQNNYTTDASFLREFKFKVENANEIQIEKNGKVIASFIYYNGNWELKDDDPNYVKTFEEATDSDRNNLRPYFENTNFEPDSRGSQATVFTATMTSRQNGDLLEELKGDAQKIELFPLTLKKEIETVYTVVAKDEGSITRLDIPIKRNYQSWEVVYPIKLEKDPYIIVNSNSTPVRVFAEDADKVLFGKNEAITFNTTQPDFKYNDDLGRSIPESYYVFESVVSLKPGLNKIKYTVVKGDNKYNDEVQIYNAASVVGGAEFRDILGKKLKFSAFDKQLELSFPKGTVLLAPSSDRIGEEARDPSREIFVDVPLYFGIADRTDGHVSIPGDEMESRLVIDPNYTYSSALYYLDAGNIDSGSQPAIGGRDPYFEGEGIVNGSKVQMDTFYERWENNLVPSKPGTLTIGYNTSIVNEANNSLTVFYNDGYGWKNIGGIVNTSNKTISVPFNGFGYYMVMKTREAFEDVIDHPFARLDLMTLYAKGIMADYPGSGFGANREMTRGELATVLVKALSLPINAGPYEDSNRRRPVEPTFLDVVPSRDSWDYEYQYIETAARAGIVSGKQPRYFRPDDPVTRQEAAIMFSRAMNLKLSTLDKAQKDAMKLYTDGSSIGFYAAPAVVAISKAKLMSGVPNDPNAKKPTYRFLPNANMTRAEMAVVTVKMMVQMKKLPKQ